MSASSSAIQSSSFAALPQWVKFLSAWVLTGILGWLDYITGHEVSLFGLFAIPIFMAVWYGSWRAGLLMAFVCAATWWIANRADNRFTTWWGYHLAAGSRLAL